MKNLKLFLFALLIPALIITSCKDDTDDSETQQSAHEMLVDHLKSNGLDLSDVLTDWIVGAPASNAVADFVGSYNIIDIRSANDFASGHIEGAQNAALEDVLTTAASFSEDKPVLVVCYTGQTAGHAVVALRLSGYTDAKVLKWGMSGWNSNFSAKWENNIGTMNHANWTTTVDLSPSVMFGEGPEISTTSTDASNILEQQVSGMLEGGLSGVTNAEVLDNYDSYFINNFWDLADVQHYGHIESAYRIKPLTLADELIYQLDPSQEVVTYCWTGQTSSMITAYLTVLGYDAVSLKFGANGMIYDNLESHKFSTPSEDLPVVTK